MRRLNKVAIIGVGLIGGSIGLALRKKRLAKEVIGVFRHKATLRRAERHKAIDRGTLDLKEGVRDADLVIIATPVHSIPELFGKVVRFAKRGAVITDVGSTKSWIVGRIERALGSSRSVFFVGSHPMAGSEHTGVEFARVDLLEGSPCIVTRTEKTDRRILAKVVSFWKALGAKVIIMSPASHDRSVSLISHIPHLLAFSLTGAVPENQMRYAAEGLKDTTRVASSDPKLWADIFLTNRKEIQRAGRLFEKSYRKMMKILSKGDYLELVRFLEKAKAKRDKLGQV